MALDRVAYEHFAAHRRGQELGEQPEGLSGFGWSFVMKTLFVAPTLPVPTSGGRTRLFNLIKQIAGRHQVSVISFIRSSEREMLPAIAPHCQHLELIAFDGFQPLGRWCNRIRGWSQILFDSRPPYAHTFPIDRMRRPLRALLDVHRYDIVIFNSLFVVELVEELQHTSALLVQENIESDIMRKALQRAEHPIHKLRDWLTWRRMLAFERRWVQRFSTCVAVSDGDAALLRQMSPSTDVHVVPNGADSAYFTPPGNQRRTDTLLFFGTLSYSPNADGLVWFCRHVLPRIREARPEVEVEVIGLDPPRRVLDLDRLPGVQVTGFVADIRTKLWSATMSVVPLRIGGGTRLKILESLAAGCPVVSTSIGAQGLALVPGEHLLLADTPDGFADRVVDLLDSPALQQELSQRGRSVVQEAYDWSIIAQQFESLLRQAVRAQHDGAKR